MVFTLAYKFVKEDTKSTHMIPKDCDIVIVEKRIDSLAECQQGFSYAKK